MFKKIAKLRHNLSSSLPLHKSTPQDFFIALDDPHRVWTPGSSLQGTPSPPFPTPAPVTLC